MKIAIGTLLVIGAIGWADHSATAAARVSVAMPAKKVTVVHTTTHRVVRPRRYAVETVYEVPGTYYPPSVLGQHYGDGFRRHVTNVYALGG
jgi:hypothetical protein